MGMILAIVVAVGTAAVCLLMLGAAGTSDAPSAADDVVAQIPWVFGGGMILAALLLASHYVHLSW